MLLAGLLTAGFVILFKPHTVPNRAPAPAHHYYISQQMALGNVLYRDIFSDKPPLADALGALCFAATGHRLYPAVVGTRMLFFFFHILTAAAVYAAARRLWKYPLAGAWAALIFLTFFFPYYRLARGAEWHLLMNFFGVGSAAAFLARRFLSAGLLAALALMSWLPGLVFIMAGILWLSLLPDIRKGKAMVLTLSGFAIPVSIWLLSAAAAGSLPDMIRQTLLFGPVNISDRFLAGLEQMPRELATQYRHYRPVAALAAAGFLAGAWLIRRGMSLRPSERFDAVLPFFLTAGTLFYSAVDFQKTPDTFPLLPWTALYAAGAAGLVPGVFTNRGRALTVSVLLFFLGAGAFAFSYRPPPAADLMEQILRDGKRLARLRLSPDDEVLSLQIFDPLIILRKKNLSKYSYLFERRYVQFVRRYEEDGMDFLPQLVQRRRPKIIFMPKNPPLDRPHFRQLRGLLARQYRLKVWPHYLVYLRRELP